MKRTRLARKTPFRRTPRPLAEPAPSRDLRAAPAPDGTTRGKPNPRRPEEREPRTGRREWYDFPRWGHCEICRKWGARDPHHVVRKVNVERVAPGLVYALDNRLLLGRVCCHAAHHRPGARDTRISVAEIPPRCRTFAENLLGQEGAQAYFARYYRER